jgi:hypothetical protein
MEDALGEILDRVMEEQFSQEKMTLILMKEKLKEYGIELTKRQEKDMILHLQKYGLEGLTLEPNRRQKALLKKLGGNDLVLDLDFQQSDLDTLQNIIVGAATCAGIKRTTKWLSDKLIKAWRAVNSILKQLNQSDVISSIFTIKFGESLLIC